MYYDIATLPIAAPEPMNGSPESRVVNQLPVRPPEVQTIGFINESIQMVPVRLDEMVPLSFLCALADFGYGRVVDIDIALNDSPPGV